MSEEGDKRQELQGLLHQIEAGKKQLEVLSGQSQNIQAVVGELNSTIKALEALEDAGEDNEILLPLGSDTFVKARLTDKERILVGVGAGVSLEKANSDAVKTLESRREELSARLKQVQESYGKISGQVNQLNAVAENMARGMRLE